MPRCPKGTRKNKTTGKCVRYTAETQAEFEVKYLATLQKENKEEERKHVEKLKGVLPSLTGAKRAEVESVLRSARTVLGYSGGKRKSRKSRKSRKGKTSKRRRH